MPVQESSRSGGRRNCVRYVAPSRWPKSGALRISSARLPPGWEVRLGGFEVAPARPALDPAPSRRDRRAADGALRAAPPSVRPVGAPPLPISRHSRRSDVRGPGEGTRAPPGCPKSRPSHWSRTSGSRALNVPGCRIAAGSLPPRSAATPQAPTSWADRLRAPAGAKTTWKQASMRSSVDLASIGAYTSRQKAV